MSGVEIYHIEEDGTQTIVAAIYIDGGRLKVQSYKSHSLLNELGHIIANGYRLGERLISPKDPQNFLENLKLRYAGEQTRATEIKEIKPS